LAILTVVFVALLLHWAIAGLDRGRLHWTDTVLDWLQASGLALVAGGYAWAMLVNRFFSSVVPYSVRPRAEGRQRRAVRVGPAPRL